MHLSELEIVKKVENTRKFYITETLPLLQEALDYILRNRVYENKEFRADIPYYQGDYICEIMIRASEAKPLTQIISFAVIIYDVLCKHATQCSCEVSQAAPDLEQKISQISIAFFENTARHMIGMCNILRSDYPTYPLLTQISTQMKDSVALENALKEISEIDIDVADVRSLLQDLRKLIYDNFIANLNEKQEAYKDSEETELFLYH